LLIGFYDSEGRVRPGCTKVACAFRDAWDRYTQCGVQSSSCPRYDAASHADFAKEHN
jgi:peroxiredoxin